MIGLDVAQMRPGIYRIWHLQSGKSYVGSSINVRRRGLRHLRELESGEHPNSLLFRAWKRYGAHAFAFEVLEYVESRDLLIATEQKHMDAFKATDRSSGYNIVPFADRHELSDETRALMSASLKGKNAGKTVPLERRRRISDALAGRKLPSETLEKRRATLSLRSQETKAVYAAKVGAALRGRPKSPAAVEGMRAARVKSWERRRQASEGKVGSGVQVRQATIRIGFTFQGKYRHQNLKIAPTPENAQIAAALAAAVRQQIAAGTFDYEAFSTDWRTVATED